MCHRIASGGLCVIELLQTILTFLFALSLLIAVHEWGHFQVARWCGVKVLRFSIGFGRPLWCRRFGADQTEFVIAAIPLGGYVKMVDEREGEVADVDLPRAFTQQTLVRRSAIVFAGPLYNFIFAILAYWLMFVVGVPGIKPLLAEVEHGTVAYEAGLRGGEEILAVNDKKTPTWQAAMEAIIPPALLEQPIKLTTFDGDLSVERILAAEPGLAMEKPAELAKRLGLRVYSPPIAPILEKIVADSPAARAGFESGDEIRFIAGHPIKVWQDLVEVISANPGRPLEVLLLREGRELRLEVRPRGVETAQGVVGRIGISPRVDSELFESLRAEMQHAPLVALAAALTKTWDMSALTLRMIGEMIRGRASVENISGPIGIAQFAKNSAAAGVSQFLAFLALISLSLGVLNLLPIPVLDGGHLLFYLVELLKGAPVSEQTEMLGQRIGLMMILALSVLAIYNDLARLLG